MLTEEERRRALAMIMQRQGLGDIFARPAPPVQATPSTPLPAMPLQVPVVAPQSEQAIAPQQYDEMAPIRRAMAQPQAVAPTGNAIMDAKLAAGQGVQQRGAQNFMDIMAAAQMNPEEQAILEEKLARNKAEQAELDKDKKGAAWRALAKAGFAMAQSNSPYFMQALATGMQAGVTGLDNEKAAAAEKRSRLQASNEDLRLSEIRGKQAAQDRAVSIYNAALAAGKSEAEAQRLARKDAEEQATLPQRMKMADLEVKGKEAQVAKDVLELARLRATPLGGFGRGGGGGGGGGGDRPAPSATAVLEETGKAVRDIGEAREKAADAFEAFRKETDPVKKQRLKETHERLAQNYRRIRDRLAVLEGRQPGSPYRRDVNGKVYTGPQRTGLPAARPDANSGLSADVAAKYGL
jgi:hypothetical protein